MIKELGFENFKSWKKVQKMRLAPITGFFGTNSSGKTSILQLLLMMKQTVESADRLQVLDFGNDNSPANLGSFRDVVHAHDVTQALKWSLEWTLRKPLEVKNPDSDRKSENLFSGDHIQFDVGISQNEKERLSVNRMSYSFSNTDFVMERKDTKKDAYELNTNSNDFEFRRTRGRPYDLPAPVKFYGFPNEVNAYFQNAGFLTDFQLEFERLFTGIKYLGPLRDYPRRQYAWSGSEPIDMGLRGEKVVEALLARSGRKLSLGRWKRKKTLEERVAEWLKELNLISSFKVERLSTSGNIYQVRVKRNANSSEVLITDVGFGVSQILPALVLCYYAPEGSTIILEQPEIHLHPAVQAGLADVFIDVVKTRDVQIIFESHSEHLLKRLQRRIAEEEMDPDQTALYFCEMEQKDSKLTSLEIDPYGNICNWPKDFFGDQFGEMAAMAKAAMKRKRTSQK